MRIGLLGIAHPHAINYLTNLRVAGADIVGIHDRDAERGLRWAGEHSVAFVPEAERLLAERLDGVVVCSETVYHVELVREAAAAGVGILCEKPLGVRLADSQEIVEVCSRAGVTLMTAFPMRFHPAVKRVRDIIATGGLGTLRALTGNNQGIIPLQQGAWFLDPALAGGGAIMDHVVHLADIFCWAVSSPPEAVYAVANRILYADEAAVETCGLMTMTFANGVFASIDCSWSRPVTYPTWGEAAFSAVGDAGTVDVDLTQPRLAQYGGEPAVSWLAHGASINQAMIDEFLMALQERRAPAVTGRDGAIATAIAVAAKESVARREVVAVPALFDLSEGAAS
ncbi:MAG: Oxidoreductase [Acidimicrobiaceae bacterium]|nr:Oxidoreductase [Acidimicrobiaceae bacterium]